MDQAVARSLTGAIAVWVKTPELSPVKTRLAATIGAQPAEAFYRLSVLAVEAVVRRTVETRLGLLTPYWAVAEEQALSHPAWASLATVSQGEGGLGTRLWHVYDALLAQHSWVLFIGADAPQITPDLLAEAAELAASGEWVLGPAEDGGFYLFGGSQPLSRELWESVPYSVADTARLLADRLRPLGRVRYLSATFDVDTAEELGKLKTELMERRDLLDEQADLLRWLLRS